MSVDPSRIQDRRRYARSEVVATAVVFSAERLHGTFLVRDMSASGASLVGHLAAPPHRKLTLLLRFPGKPAFSLTAQVARHEPRAPIDDLTAVSFVNLSPEQEDTIHEAIVAALERERARLAATILVIDPDGPSRDALERDLRTLGHQSVGVATPLEALSWLERPDARISTVVVDLSSGAGQGLDVLEFLGEHHPQIQRIVMAGEARPFRLDLALRSGRAHRALRKPWDRRRLAEAIGRAGVSAQETH